MTIAEFIKTEEFDERFKLTCSHLNLDAKSYADLKADPERYNLTEDTEYMRFIVKNKLETGELDGVIVFTVSIPGRVQIKHMHLYKSDIDFINETIKGENWV